MLTVTAVLRLPTHHPHPSAPSLLSPSLCPLSRPWPRWPRFGSCRPAARLRASWGPKRLSSAVKSTSRTWSATHPWLPLSAVLLCCGRTPACLWKKSNPSSAACINTYLVTQKKSGVRMSQFDTWVKTSVAQTSKTMTTCQSVLLNQGVALKHTHARTHTHSCPLPVVQFHKLPMWRLNLLNWMEDGR